MNVCLLTCHSITNPLNRELAVITGPNHRDYAMCHGYSQTILRMDWQPSILGFMHSLKRLLPQFDMVLTHGTDVAFMNHSITPEDVCRKVGHKRGVMFSRESHTEFPINNDVGIWINDDASMAVIDRIIADYELWRDEAFIWQTHLWNLLKTDKDFASCVTLAMPRDMNASPGGDNEARWKIGDWLCHFLGHSELTKIPIAKAMLKKCSTDGTYHGPTTVYRRVKRLSKRDKKIVAICIPNYEGMCHMETFAALMQLLMQGVDGYTFVKLDAGGTQVPRMRDILVWKARNTLINGKQIGQLLWLDWDVIPTIQQVARIVQHHVPVVGGLVPLKQPPFNWCGTPIPGKGVMSNGLQEWHELPTGFKCYDVDVFDAMAEQYPETAYEESLPEFNGATMNFFFHDRILDRHRLSEDYEVDRKWREMGGVLYADTTLKMGHMARLNALTLRTQK